MMNKVTLDISKFLEKTFGIEDLGRQYVDSWLVAGFLKLDLLPGFTVKVVSKTRLTSLVERSFRANYPYIDEDGGKLAEWMDYFKAYAGKKVRILTTTDVDNATYTLVHEAGQRYVDTPEGYWLPEMFTDVNTKSNSTTRAKLLAFYDDVLAVDARAKQVPVTKFSNDDDDFYENTLREEARAKQARIDEEERLYYEYEHRERTLNDW